MTRFSLRRLGSAVLTLASLAACGDDDPARPGVTGFLAGTSDNREIGVVVNSTNKSMTLFQLGSPTTQKTIAFGTSSTVTPVGFATRGLRAAVPLGNAASVALVNLDLQTVTRYFTFASGNATGSAFFDDTTIIAANTSNNVAGRFTTGQSGDAITTLSPVLAPVPTDIEVSGNRVLVVSSNLNASFAPIGNGIVTALDPRTLAVLGTATMGGRNSTDAAVGPDGLLYVVNTEDYVAQGSLTIVNPATMAVVATVPNMGVGAGSINIDANGLAYISGFSSGTVVWNTRTRTFVRDASNPVCARRAGTNACRGAFAATTNGSGDVYQAFFGSASQGLAPYVFVYRGASYTLSDSIAVGMGPAAIQVRTF